MAWATRTAAAGLLSVTAVPAGTTEAAAVVPCWLRKTVHMGFGSVDTAITNNISSPMEIGKKGVGKPCPLSTVMTDCPGSVIGR